MSHFDERKSTGHVDISLKFIKAARFVIAPHLVKILNNCVSSVYYPDILKVAKVVPLHKKGNREDIGNYRAVSIRGVAIIVNAKR